MSKTPTQNDWTKDYIKIRAANRGKAYSDTVSVAQEVEFIENLLADARKEVIMGLDEKIEKLAELEHEQWWKWAKTLTEKETLSKERVERWQKDMVPYKDLSEDVKEYDRKWARKVLATLREEKTK